MTRPRDALLIALALALIAAAAAGLTLQASRQLDAFLALDRAFRLPPTPAGAGDRP